LLCSLVDTFIWGGSLDYIYLKPLFVFDLKDLYNKIWLIPFLFYFFKNRNHIETIKSKELIVHFKNQISSIANKGK
jgi:hypothetical protein